MPTIEELRSIERIASVAYEHAKSKAQAAQQDCRTAYDSYCAASAARYEAEHGALKQQTRE